MTPSQIAKSYGAKSVNEIAEFHNKTRMQVIHTHRLSEEDFEYMCWQWAKAKAPYAKFLRRAFIDGVILCGLPDGNAANMANMKGYSDE